MDIDSGQIGSSTIQGPIDIYTGIANGCVCSRVCWDRLIQTGEEMDWTIKRWHCKDHKVLHTFDVGDDGRSIVGHPNCPLYDA